MSYTYGKIHAYQEGREKPQTKGMTAMTITAEIRNLNFRVTATKGCDFFDADVIDTVVLSGLLDGVGIMVPQDGPHRVRLEMDVFFGWCRETGERLTVRWNFDADSRIMALSMLMGMTETVRHGAEERAEEGPVAA